MEVQVEGEDVQVEGEDVLVVYTLGMVRVEF